MTDAQLLTLVLSMVIPLSLLLYSNSKITDAKETLRAEMSLHSERLMSTLDKMERQMEQNHRELLQRIQRIEDKVGIEYPAGRR